MRRASQILAALEAALLAGALALGATGCNRRTSPAPRDRSPPAAAAASGARAPDRAVVAGLLAGAQRAELFAGGLFVDLGTVDDHKYTRGGWLSGWGRALLDPGRVTARVVDADTATLRVYLDPGEAPRSVSVRLRSDLAGQKARVLLNGVELGGSAVGRDWKVVALAVPPRTFRRGWNTVSLRLDRGAATAARAHVDWAWLRTGVGPGDPPAAPRAAPLRLGTTTRRALVAAAPRRDAFDPYPPANARLTFDYGALVPTTFSVRVTDDEQGSRELFRAVARPGAWQHGEVDLAAHAGRALRIDLVTNGPPGPAGWGEPEITAPAAPRRPLVGPRPRNVIMVVIDAARADVFRAFNSKSTVKADAFDALAAESTAMRGASATASWTKPSVASMLTGVHGPTHGVRRHDAVLPLDLPLVGELLQRKGYATALFTDNPGLAKDFGFDRGFGLYRRFVDGFKVNPGLIFGAALAFVRAQRGQPFFVYLHTLGAHAPYRELPGCTSLYRAPAAPAVGGNLRRLFIRANDPAAGLTETDRELVRALYYGEITCHDQHLGAFVAGLREAGLLENTLLIVTSDHGEELFDHGHVGHAHALYEELLRVPLLVRYPPWFAGGAHLDDAVEGADIAPTILDALGVEVPPHMEGASFLPLVAGSPRDGPAYAIAEQWIGNEGRSIRLGRYKMIVIGERLAMPAAVAFPFGRLQPRPRPPGSTLYDLAVDPRERVDQQERLPIARRLCEVFLGEGLALPHKGQRAAGTSSSYRFDSGRAKLDPKLKRHLEALGYLQ